MGALGEGSPQAPSGAGRHGISLRPGFPPDSGETGRHHSVPTGRLACFPPRPAMRVLLGRGLVVHKLSGNGYD